MTSLETIVRDPRVSQLSVRVKHGSDDIIVDAFWSGPGSLQTLVGVGPTVEAAVEQMSAEIRRREKPTPTPVNFLPILPGDPA